MPLVTSADVVSTWTVYSGNVWQAALTTEPSQVWFDRTRGTKAADLAGVDADQKWWWATGVLYQYSATDPDSRYTTPGTEASIRGITIYIPSMIYVSIDSLAFGYTNGVYEDGLRAYNSDYLNITNCLVTSCFGDGIYLIECDYGTVDGCEATLNMSAGIDAEGTTSVHATNITFSNNLAHHNVCIPDDGIHGYGIKFMYVSDSVIRNNLSYSNSGSGINLDGQSDPTPFGSINNLVYENLVHDNMDEGILVEIFSTGNKVYRNVFYDNGLTNAQGEICFNRNCTGNEITYNVAYKTKDMGSHQLVIVWFNSSGNKFYNNILYGGNVAATAFDIQEGVSATNMVLKNNICVETTSRPLSVHNCSDYATFVSDFNCWRRHDGNSSVISYDDWGGYTLATFYSTWGQDEHSIGSDPLFTNPGAGDFSLQSGSPCRNAGSNLGSSFNNGLMPGSTWPDEVVTGDQNQHGIGWEIGAFMYSELTSFILGLLAVGGS
jgi:parallel beta-helix repeat protein